MRAAPPWSAITSPCRTSSTAAARSASSTATEKAGCARCRAAKEVQDEIHANQPRDRRMAMADIGAVLKFLDDEPAARRARRAPSAIASAAGCRSRPRPSTRCVSRLRQHARHHAGEATAGSAAPLRRTKCAARVYCGFAEHDPGAPPSDQGDAGESVPAERAQRPLRATVHPARARLLVAGPRHLRQGERQPRLGEHLCDVQA